MGQTWVVAETIVDTLFLVVKKRGLNQTQRYWLLSNALTSIFNLCIIMKIGVVGIETLIQPLMCDDFDLEL
jgi:hypothetical protein